MMHITFIRTPASRILFSFASAIALTLIFSVLLLLASGTAAGAQIDTDNDGLSDAAERSTYKTDPAVGDTDGDGLPDGVEVTLETDPLLLDTDGDGISDAQEYLRGTNPLQPSDAPTPEASISSTSLVPEPVVASNSATGDISADTSDLDVVPTGTALAFNDESGTGSPAWYLLPVAMMGGAWFMLPRRARDALKN